jgi:hypothetical protein
LADRPSSTFLYGTRRGRDVFAHLADHDAMG